jgi:peptidyl-dipeptidase Dcp
MRSAAWCEEVLMRLMLSFALLAAAPLVVSAAQQAQPAPQANPLLAEWTTPFAVPPFDQIKDEHFLPAYQEAIARQRAEVEAIASSREKPTFANTVEALEGAGELLDRVVAVFSNLDSADTNDRRQAIAKQVAPMMAALRDDIQLSEPLFARVKAVWDARASLALTPVQAKLLEETYKSFVRGGANLTPEQKERFRAINQELSVLSVTFGENLLKETNSYRLVIDKKEDLAGLSDRVVAGAAEAAKSAKLEGKWVFTLHAPSIWPFLEAADNRELRRQILAAYTSRGANGNAQDNRKTLSRIAALRAEKAALLGYKTHADYVLEERMAKTPDKVYGLLNQLWVPASKVAKKEAEALQQMIAAGGSSFQLEPADWRYYAEKVKKARFDLDENALRPYFPLERVREGAFFVANRLYGLTFVERKDLPVYNPEVKAFEVKDADGSHLGVFYVDVHPRPGKRGGAWSGGYRQQRFRDGKDVRPVVVNVCNFSRPTGDAPALLSIEEVETLFHEFGHGLHSLLSRIPYRMPAGVPRDFVELPSQIMENWVLQPEVLKVYARHYKTGEVLPDAQIAKIEAARKFNQGFASVEYLAASFLDMDWHVLAEPKEQDADAFEKAALGKISLMPEIVSRYRSPYFAHIFSGGYSAGYYSYIWAEVLDADAFEAFKEKGIFDPQTARSFRTNILEKGATEDAMEMYKRFRGREPRVEPLLAKRGLD